MNKNNLTIIKKYANRRLYDTGRSSYVTLDDLADMLREGHDFKVVDAKTDKDLTQGVLTQIIVEQESKESSPNLLPQQFLKEIIKFYGSNMQRFVPIYLNHAMVNFVQAQKTIQEQMEQSFGTIMPADPIPNTEQAQNIAKQNTEIMQKMVETFVSFDSTINKKD
jgi:polyhydroxyalkanoate synthesis repressor PhaR